MFVCALIHVRRRTSRKPLQQLSLPHHEDPPLLVMSFGSVCLTARSLGEAGARTFAAPFDWIFSNPAIVAHIISSGGATLLDAHEYSRANGGCDGAVGTCHRTYSPMLAAGHRQQNKHAIIFNHHDPTRAEDHAYFERTVARLRAALASPLPKLCVVCSLERRARLQERDLDVLLEALAQHSNPNGAVTLVAIKLTTGGGDSAAPTHGNDGAGPGIGLENALRHREKTLRHATLRVIEMRCRGGLGPKALWLADPADRRDLLCAIFGADAQFDDAKTGPRLTRPVLAGDPIAGDALGASCGEASLAADAAAAEAGPDDQRHRRRGTMYGEDRYLVARGPGRPRGMAERRDRERRERREQRRSAPGGTPGGARDCK